MPRRLAVVAAAALAATAVAMIAAFAFAVLVFFAFMAMPTASTFVEVLVGLTMAAIVAVTFVVVFREVREKLTRSSL